MGHHVCARKLRFDVAFERRIKLGQYISLGRPIAAHRTNGKDAFAQLKVLMKGDRIDRVLNVKKLNEGKAEESTLFARNKIVCKFS